MFRRSHLKSLFFFIFICLMLPNYAFAIDSQIRINKVVGAKEELIHSMLKLSLSYSNKTDFLVQKEEEIPSGRLVVDTEEGNIDVMWAGSSAELDARLLAVRIPLLKGLLGHRVFIIRDGDQKIFDAVSTLAQLSKLQAGMGRFWGATKVLQNAGLPVITSVKYKNLFDMLDGSRFDYFLRAAHEPWSEVEEHAQLPLTVEQRLLLIYPYAMYFYVNKDNEKLHHTLLSGLEKAIKDGSFDGLFYNHPMIKSAVEKTKFAHRITMRIDNPAMHPETPLSRPELWLDIQRL